MHNNKKKNSKLQCTICMLFDKVINFIFDTYDEINNVNLSLSELQFFKVWTLREFKRGKRKLRTRDKSIASGLRIIFLV